MVDSVLHGFRNGDVLLNYKIKSVVHFDVGFASGIFATV
jgi:hypothetical protein